MIYNTLFLCTGNSARSVLAEATLNDLGRGRFRAFSAGSLPSGRVNPFALELLTQRGHPVDGVRSKSWDEFAAAPAGRGASAGASESPPTGAPSGAPSGAPQSPSAGTPPVPQMDFIITVCANAAGEACPLWPGHPATAHWGVEDPAAVEGSDAAKHAAFLTAYSILRRRIERLLALPLDALDTDAIKAHLKEIGNVP